MSDYWVKLRGLPYRTTMDDILEFMSGVNIKGKKRGIFFPVSQKNIEWGEAFIELESEEDLNNARMKHNKHMGRRYIEVFTSSKSDMDSACKQQKVVEDMRNRITAKRGRSRSPLQQNYVVRIKGLPFNASKADIKDFFTGLKIIPDGMSILIDENGKALGDAFVQFASYHDARLAKERTGNKIGHRYIELFDSNIDEANAEIRRQMEINDLHMNQYEKSPPRSRNLNLIDDAPYGGQSRNAYSQLPSIVKIRGVSLNVRADDVFYFFRPLVPLSINMKFTNGTSEGEIDVEFATEDEAYSALSRDRERLGSTHVVLSIVPLRDEYHQYNDSIPVSNYGRREREVNRVLPVAGRSSYSERDGLYQNSRYY